MLDQCVPSFSGFRKSKVFHFRLFTVHNLIITIRGCDHKINCAVAGFGVWHRECVVECADRVMHFIVTKVDLRMLNHFGLNDYSDYKQYRFTADQLLLCCKSILMPSIG